MEQLKFLKIKITPQKLNLFAYLIISVITVLLIAWTSFFVYKNIYQAIIQSEEILILQKEVAISTVDMNKFNEIIEKIELKTSERQLEEMDDPFN